jgi:hypothetical protein
MPEMYGICCKTGTLGKKPFPREEVLERTLPENGVRGDQKEWLTFWGR